MATKVSRCDGIGEIMASAFGDRYDRFEQVFKEEAEITGFFKLFSVENGMIKLAGAADQYGARELLGREQNLDKILQRIESEDAKTNRQRQMMAQEAGNLRAMIVQRVMAAIKTGQPPDQIQGVLTQLLEENKYSPERVPGFVKYIMSQMNLDAQPAPVPQVQRIKPSAPATAPAAAPAAQQPAMV
jgi:hypothetical protein